MLNSLLIFAQGTSWPEAAEDIALIVVVGIIFAILFWKAP